MVYLVRMTENKSEVPGSKDLTSEMEGVVSKIKKHRAEHLNEDNRSSVVQVLGTSTLNGEKVNANLVLEPYASGIIVYGEGGRETNYGYSTGSEFQDQVTDPPSIDQFSILRLKDEEDENGTYLNVGETQLGKFQELVDTFKPNED